MPTINEYLVRVLNEGEMVGFDGKCLSVGSVKELIQSLQVKNTSVAGIAGRSFQMLSNKSYSPTT